MKDLQATGEVLEKALRDYGFPVSKTAFANARDGMSREALALHLAAEQFAEALRKAAA